MKTLGTTSLIDAAKAGEVKGTVRLQHSQQTIAIAGTGDSVTFQSSYPSDAPKLTAEQFERVFQMKQFEIEDAPDKGNKADAKT